MTRELLHRLRIETVDRQVLARDDDFLNVERAFDRHRQRRIPRRLTSLHLHQDAIVKRSARTEAADLVVAHQHKFLDAAHLRRGQNEAANANPLLCDLLPKNSWSTAVGLMNTTNCFAGGVGILIAGYLKRDFGLGGIFAGTAGIVLVAGILLLLGYLLFLRGDLERSQNASRSAPVIAKEPGPDSALQES